MGQRAVAWPITFLVLISLLAAGSSCDRSTPRAASPTTQQTPKITVASLVPAATDLIVGMGAADHLVAVSNWEPMRPETDNLPKAGDYRSIDWEKISIARPTAMIVQFREDKMPQGLRERASELKITLVNVKNNTLEDLFVTMRQLGDALGEREKASAAEKALRAELESVKRDVGSASVTALITRAEPAGAIACVGGGNYLDELLTLAGGKNVLAGGDNSYPSIDVERAIQLDPQVIIALLPGASPQVVEQTKAFWNRLPQLSAVKNKRVYILTEPYLLLPGANVGKVARTFAEKLHGSER